MKRFFLGITALLLGLTAAIAQVTTTPNPIPVGHSGQVIIVFDPAGGNGGMVGATKCYCHTGVLTQKSKSSSDWKYVIGSWRGTTQPQLTATKDGKWQLTIDNLNTFYNIAVGDTIKSLCFVFHDGPSGKKEGKTSSGADIIITLGEESQGDIWDDFTPAAVTEQARPAGVSNGIYYNPDGSVTLCTYAASKTAPAQHVFLLGDMTNWKLNNSYQLKRDGNYFWITLTGLQQKEYRFQYAVMRADGVKKQISELYSEKVLHPDDAYEPLDTDPTLIGYPMKGADGGYVSVIEPGRAHYAYNWQNTSFTRPNKNNLIIYEAWVYDYTPQRNLAGLMTRLDYISTLGVNAIELMPVCEFDGNYNWGYSPNHYFALDKAYGTPQQFKQFVDSCHGRGIAVIMDMVFNHATGLNPMNKLYPYGTDLASNPWFNVVAPHGDNVYEDWNHGFGPAHEMFIRSLQYWQSEYHIDGYRMDLSHGFCSDVAGTAVNNIKDYYNQAMAPTGAYFILEHWGTNAANEQAQLVQHGCLCWNSSINNAACQTAMGWLKDGDSYANANKDGYVDYTCSHDEERPFYKAKTYGNGDIKTNANVRNGRIAANMVMNVLLNGPHMIWQYEEVGYDYSINSSLENPTGTSSDNRCSKKPRPETAGFFVPGIRMQQYARVAKAIQLRTRLMASVFEGNPTASTLTSGAAIRSVQWGSDVYVVANYGLNSDQIYLPNGTWYDYLDGSAVAPATMTLNAGEVKVFTGRQIVAPSIPKAFVFPTGIDETYHSDGPSAEMMLHNGRIEIRKANRTYDIMGRRVR